MKKLKASTIGILLIMCFLHSAAQDRKIPINDPDYNKPKLFSDLPQKMELRISEMEKFFTLPVGRSMNAKLSTNFNFAGTVVSKSNPKNSGAQTVVIRSSNRPGAVFVFTKRTNADGSFSFIGRIFSRNNSDAYELTSENGKYILQKKNYYDIINE